MTLMQAWSLCFVLKKLGSRSIVEIEVTENSLSLILYCS